MLYLAADIHLVPRVWKHRSVLEGDSYRAWNRMVDQIIADEAQNKTLLLAGDILDFRMISGDTLEALTTEGFDRLFDSGVGVIFTQGNHDLNKVPHLSVLGGLHTHGKLTKTTDGRMIYGLDYMPRADLQEQLTKVPECDVLMMHAAGQHLLGFEGAYDYTLEMLPNTPKNILVGDIHVTDITELSGGNRVISPGSLHPLNIGEGGDHGYYKLHEDNTLEFVTVPGRAIARFSVVDDDTSAEAEAFIKGMPDCAEEMRTLVELTFDPKYTSWAVGLAHATKEKAVYFLSEKLATPAGVALDGDRPVYEQMSLRDALGQIKTKDTDQEVFEFTDTLLASNDPDNYITEWLGDLT